VEFIDKQWVYWCIQNMKSEILCNKISEDKHVFLCFRFRIKPGNTRYLFFFGINGIWDCSSNKVYLLGLVGDWSERHSYCRLEVALLLIIYIAYGYTKGGSSSFILITISSWILVFSWLFAPYIFNPSGFEWQKYVYSNPTFKSFPPS